MKVRIAEAEGPTLDWAVAKCLGWVTYPTDSIEHGDWYHTNAAIAPHGYEHNRVHRGNFKPSTDWSQGGPIIERERIEVIIWQDIWSAMMRSSTQQDGPTPLIAAMRCYVANKLGDEIDVPTGLD